jgi:hypothetical protein
MNLVKVSEDLKSVPVQALQAYMNGMNPEVPPYLAQAEMMRRQRSMEKQKMAEGAQGDMPSVKEQVEEAAGLMSLQQQREQQAMQQMGQQAQQQPMPVGEGVPQPSAQPSGVAGLDMPSEMFEMAGGGIVPFQAGGSMYQQAYRQGEQKGSIYDKNFGQPRDVRRRAQEGETRKRLEARLARAEEALSQPDVTPQYAETLEREIQNVKGELSLIGAGTEQSDARFARGPSMMGITNMPAAPMPVTPNLAQAQPAVPKPAAGITAGMEQRFPAVVPEPFRGMPPPSGPEKDFGVTETPPSPATPSVGDEATNVLTEFMRQQPAAYTPEMAGEVESKLAEQSGLAALAQQREAMRKQYGEATKDRGFETFLATMAGGARGYGGTAASYLDAQRAARDADLRFAQEMYGLETAPAEKRYDSQGRLLTAGRAETEAAKGRRLTAARELAPAPGATVDKTTGVERIMADVRRLQQEGKPKEAQALMELYRKLQFAGTQGARNTEQEIRKMAIESALKAGITDRKEIQDMADAAVDAFRGGESQEPATVGATSSTMPSSPKALADQLKKQLGR